MNRSRALALPLVAMSLAVALLSWSSMFLSFNLPCLGFGKLGHTFDYVLEIETKKDPSQFEYPGSLIGPIVRTSVSYVKPDNDEFAPVRYEDLWYHEWQALGCRRYHELDLGTSAQIAIEIKHQPESSQPQNAAAANAALRVMLDVFAGRNSVACLIVPDDDMKSIGLYMEKAGFRMGNEPPPEQPIACSLLIPVQSKSGQNRQVLYYYPN
ncbi:MAG: hypothetical protein K2Z81_23780 [Cyanobacteria bacterium]|nr:hypothetical protein [Cyanobacteriota bacterium]